MAHAALGPVLTAVGSLGLPCTCTHSIWGWTQPMCAAKKVWHGLHLASWTDPLLSASLGAACMPQAAHALCQPPVLYAVCMASPALCATHCCLGVCYACGIQGWHGHCMWCRVWDVGCMQHPTACSVHGDGSSPCTSCNAWGWGQRTVQHPMGGRVIWLYRW